MAIGLRESGPLLSKQSWPNSSCCSSRSCRWIQISILQHVYVNIGGGGGGIHSLAAMERDGNAPLKVQLRGAGGRRSLVQISLCARCIYYRQDVTVRKLKSSWDLKHFEQSIVSVRRRRLNCCQLGWIFAAFSIGTFAALL